MNPPDLTLEQRDLIQAGRVVMRMKNLHRLTLHHRAILDALTWSSLSQGKRSVKIPTHLALHDICGVPAQHIPRAIEDLKLMRIVQVRDTEDGMKVYRVNPDYESWNAGPVVADATARATRNLIAQINGWTSDEVPPLMKSTIPAFEAHDSCAPHCVKVCDSKELPTSFLRKAAA